MKLTKPQLKQIIREEREAILSETQESPKGYNIPTEWEETEVPERPDRYLPQDEAPYNDPEALNKDRFTTYFLDGVKLLINAHTHIPEGARYDLYAEIEDEIVGKLTGHSTAAAGNMIGQLRTIAMQKIDQTLSSYEQEEEIGEGRMSRALTGAALVTGLGAGLPGLSPDSATPTAVTDVAEPEEEVEEEILDLSGEGSFRKAFAQARRMELEKFIYNGKLKKMVVAKKSKKKSKTADLGPEVVKGAGQGDDVDLYKTHRGLAAGYSTGKAPRRGDSHPYRTAVRKVRPRGESLNREVLSRLIREVINEIKDKR